MSATHDDDVTPDGHVYDGIEEHDNKLPRWWLATLWGTVFFGVGYWVWFHTLAVGILPTQALALKMQERAVAEEAAIAAAPAVDDAALVAMMKDAALVERGRAVYNANCIACHADKGQGLVGPNLTDDVWVHENTPVKLVQVIAEGVLTKGMPAWKPALGTEKVNEVTVFVMTLKGTNVAGKAAEGAIPTAN